MKAIGLIVGHGFCKAVSDYGVAHFPAVAAPAPASDYTAIGGGASVVSMNGKGDWLVGEDAITFAPARLVNILDRSRYGHPSFLALARAALLKVAQGGAPGPARILTGMPSAWFADRAARSALEAAIVEAAAPIGGAVVTVAPEAAGVYYAYIFGGGRLDPERKAAAVGVIDAGYRDVNVAYFTGGRYVGGESVAGGAVEAVREVKRLIAQAYGLELAPLQVDAAIRAGELKVDGMPRPLPEGTAAALTRGLDTVVATGRALWPNGGRGLDALVLGGGYAAPLRAGLQALFPQLVALELPHLSGAQGFKFMAAAAAGAGS